jgi:uncharacterized protein YoxC
MDPATLSAVSLAVIAAMFVIFAVFAIRTLIQVRRTAAEVERTVRRAQPALTELEAAVREVRGLTGRLTDTVARVDLVVGNIETLSSHAARAGTSVLSGLGGSIGKAAAVMAAVRTGASIFKKILGRNHKEPRVRERVPADEAKVR